ncbi:putative transporter [Diplonema papillatum]|nr:putative transporter [Diplonema papillatum]|eukprot:gene22590-34572_t
MPDAAGPADAGGARPERTLSWTREVPLILRLSLPVFVSRSAWTVMKTTDSALLGHVGSEYLEASSLSDLWTMIAGVFIMGRSLRIFASQAFGAGKPEVVWAWYKVALLVTSLISVPVFVTWLFTRQALEAIFGVEHDIARNAGRYALILSACIPLRILNNLANQLFMSQKILHPAVYASAWAMVFNVAAGLLLVTGAGLWDGFGFLACPLVTFGAEVIQFLILYGWYRHLLVPEGAGGEREKLLGGGGQVGEAASPSVGADPPVKSFDASSSEIAAACVNAFAAVDLSGSEASSQQFCEPPNPEPVPFVPAPAHRHSTASSALPEAGGEADEGEPSGIDRMLPSGVTTRRITAYVKLYLPTTILLGSDFWRMAAIGFVAQAISSLDAAVFNSSYRILWAANSFVGSIGAIVGIRIGMKLGANDHGHARFTAACAVGLAFAVAAAISVLSFFSTRLVAHIFSSDPEVIENFSAICLWRCSSRPRRLCSSRSLAKPVFYAGVGASWFVQVPAVYALFTIYDTLAAVYSGVAIGYAALCLLYGIVVLRLDWKDLTLKAQERAPL